MVKALLAAQLALQTIHNIECRVACTYEVERAVGGVARGSDECLCLVPIDRKAALGEKYLSDKNKAATFYHEDDRAKRIYNSD